MVGFGTECSPDNAVPGGYAVCFFTDMYFHDRGEEIVVGLYVRVIPALQFLDDVEGGGNRADAIPGFGGVGGLSGESNGNTDDGTGETAFFAEYGRGRCSRYVMEGEYPVDGIVIKYFRVEYSLGTAAVFFGGLEEQ